MTHPKASSHEQAWPFGIIVNSFHAWSSRCPWKMAKGEASKVGGDTEQEGACRLVIIHGNQF